MGAAASFVCLFVCWAARRRRIYVLHMNGGLARALQVQDIREVLTCSDSFMGPVFGFVCLPA